MPTSQDLANYIKEGTARGVSRSQMTEVLLQHGWKHIDIEMAFASLTRPTVVPLSSQPPPSPAPQPPPSPVTSPVQPAPATPIRPAIVSEPPPVPTYTPLSAHPFPSVSPSVSKTPPVQMSAKPFKKSLGRGALIALSVFVVLGLVGGVVYGFVNKIGPFARIPYTESNIFSGILAKSSDIQSSTYSFTGAIKVETRDTDAKPFELHVSNEGELREQYQNDYERAQSISAFLYYLQSAPSLPRSMSDLFTKTKAQRTYLSSTLSATDPVTNKFYEYKVTEKGDFELTVTFETSAALLAVNRYGGSSGTTVSGKTITFTSGSSPYFYLSPEPPKPFLVTLGEMMRSLPSEIDASVGVTVASDWKKEKADWKINVNAEGDFGDLTYKVNADALKKGDIYYFRINNLPSLFLGPFASVKEKWIKIDPAASTTNPTHNQFSSMAAQFREAEESYKERRAEWVAFFKKIVQFADEEKLVHFIKSPHSETVDGRLLYRYDFETRKEAVLPFYIKVVEEAGKNPETAYAKLFNDQGLLDYLKSEEFSEVFDYLNDNLTTTLWVDAKGFPARVEYSMRIVPPDTAILLADKQIRITWVVVTDDINTSVEIEEPKDAKPIETLAEELASDPTSSALGGARAKGIDAKITSEVYSIAVYAEIYYDTNNSYGPPTSSCTKGMFASDSNIARLITSLSASAVAADPICYASPTAWAVQHPLIASNTSICVDSTGARITSPNKLTTTVCK